MLTYKFAMNNTYYIYISATGRKQQRETARSVHVAAREAPPITHEQVGTSIQRAYGIVPPAAPPAGSAHPPEPSQADSPAAPAGSAHPPGPSQAVPPAAPPAGSDHDSSDSSDPPHPPSAGAVAANGKRKK